MFKNDLRFAIAIPVAVAAMAASAVMAQEPRPEGPAATTALVYVESKTGAHLDPQSLEVQVNGHPAEVSGVEPVAGEKVQVAILIDSGVRSSFNLQLHDIEAFVSSMPPNTEVLLGYMENGTVRSTTGFTTDKEKLLGALHIPMSVPGMSASPYFCLSDLVKHWPSQEPAARFVLMLTNGVDPYNGSTSPMNQDSPYVQTAQDDAARAGVAVYSIYFPDAGFRGGRGSFSGQSYLQQVGEATGGMVLNIGPVAPVSIGPYLRQFERAVNETYKVTFLASVGNGKANTLDRLKVKSSQQGVKIHAPEEIHPGTIE